MGMLSTVGHALAWATALVAMVAAVQDAYEIRMYAVRTFGRIIHEFDPWFNFRAAQYLADNGWRSFFTWYDHRSWYPIGRPVGTTIFPGMQFTAVWLWRALGRLGVSMTLNDVCVLLPAWFGGVASVLIGLTTYEATGGSLASCVTSTAIMAVIPAHIMRSIGGKYDNECVAVAGMCATFWLWLRSLRSDRSWPIGALAGLAYAYMAASWGGYIFAGNMVAVHALVLVLTGRFSSGMHRSYSLFWLVSALLASRVPVIGMAPFRTIEQAAPMLAFAGLQALALTAGFAARSGLSWNANRRDMLRLHAMVATVGALAVMALLFSGFFWDASIRVRSLFVKHTRTGNPLVDSVSEHQPASREAYWAYLNIALPLMIPGVIICLLRGVTDSKRSAYGLQAAKLFPPLYAAIAYYFANRMSRLVLMMGPIASILAGIAVGYGIEWCLRQFRDALTIAFPVNEEAPKNAASGAKPGKKQHPLDMSSLKPLAALARDIVKMYSSQNTQPMRIVLAAVFLFFAMNHWRAFHRLCHLNAERSSQPSLMFMTQQNGKPYIVRDYWDAYKWVEANTPEDARVLAWWDYGYHISGIANRTSIADGNTWNLEHIATIGRIMTAPERKGWELARQIADYVLVWAGQHRDDISKSRHLARIGASVYDDVCPQKDPLCYSYSIKRDGTPTPSMAASMLYKMHSGGVRPGVSVDKSLFREVYTSEHGLVRVYKILNVDEESKKWLADPANYVCRVPGDWYCVGQYPPGFPRPPKTHRNVKYDD